MEQFGFTMQILCLKDADGMVNSVKSDQAASLWAVWLGSALFALQSNLSQYFEFSQLHI